MVIEYSIPLEGRSHPVVISDEPEALLAAKAAGRAIIGVENSGNKWKIICAPYVIPDFEDATWELARLVLLRHLGLPWVIGTTGRLLVREFVQADAGVIPEEEYGAEEAIFRSPELMAHYIEKQYGFYEYGTWALIEKESGTLAGMAGVSNPRLPKDMEGVLERLDAALLQEEGSCPGKAGEDTALPWLELGYHVFRPFRRRGYAKEATAFIQDYAHEVLKARLCALIHTRNRASCAVAEALGMECVIGTGIQSSEGPHLYVERWTPRPDRGDP